MENRIVIFSTTSGMTDCCKKVLSKRRLEGIAVYELTTSDALQKARAVISQGIKVIICRGGSANYLRAHLDLPIVDVRYSFLSVLETVRKARRIAQWVALVGFEPICAVAERYNALMGDEVLLEKINHADEVEAAFLRAKRRGAQVMVGGLQIETVCRRESFPFVSSYPDESEVNQALDEALYSVHVEEERAKQYTLLKTVLNSVPEGIVGIDSTGKVLHINRPAQKLFAYQPGDDASALLEIPGIAQAVKTGVEVTNELMTVGNIPTAFGCLPIWLDQQTIGAVVTMQEESAIQVLDTKIRRRQLGNTHVAKRCFQDLVGNSPALTAAKETAHRFAMTQSTILITGETGTGKELFAQSIHNASTRRDAPFVAVNCAALPQNILESELFGYVRGAFTGARTEGKAGIFELAHMGTVFLDEISEIPLEVQAKLLRVLQEREVVRMGDDKVIPINVRILAACNKNLRAEMQAGRFREDLYYRVCVLELTLPPLRERKEDIAALIAFFLTKSKTLLPDALEFLQSLAWEGNIRELVNVTQRLEALCPDTQITSEQARRAVGFLQKAPAPKQSPDELLPSGLFDVSNDRGLLPLLEERLIRQVVEKTGGNRERAAVLLGISMTTLWRRMRDLEIG